MRGPIHLRFFTTIQNNAPRLHQCCVAADTIHCNLPSKPVTIKYAELKFSFPLSHLRKLEHFPMSTDFI
uniref:Uncharacterized protein n=1 Tax=Nelumbo nucifera TaxID=4432 RepID=A0A822Y7L0_NELNU|nr:TPA_asm: hypothetical protein HUJ06_029491 [Nelumbo nucifera]